MADEEEELGATSGHEVEHINQPFEFKSYKCELRVRAAYEQRVNYARAAYANSYEQRANYARTASANSPANYAAPPSAMRMKKLRKNRLVCC